MCILYYVHNDCVIAKYDSNTYNIPYCTDQFKILTTLEEYNKIINDTINKDNWLSTSKFYEFVVKNDINLEYLSKNALVLKKKLKIII